MTMKTKLMAIAAAAVLVSPLAQAAKIGVTMASFDDTFLTILRNSIQTTAQKNGATVEAEDAGNDIGKQLNQIQNMIAQKDDAIIVNPVDTDVTPKITKMVAAAGIPLIYVNRKPVDFDKLPPGVAVVASDERASGTLETQAVCKLLHGQGSVMVLMGDLSNEAARTRTQDIDNVLATKECSGIKIVDKREGKWSRTAAQDITMNWISSGATFNGIVSNDDEMAIGAINALKATRKLKGVVVAGVDATPDGLAAMNAGDLQVTVYQNAKGQGAGAVETALKLIKKDKVDRFVNVPFQLVTPANMSQFVSKP